MALSHFIKHLACRCFYRPHPRHLIQPISPATRFSELSYGRCWQPVLGSSNHAKASAFSLSTITCSEQKPVTAFETDLLHSSSSYVSARIHCPTDAVDAFSEALLCFGAVSTIVDEDDSDGAADKIFITSMFPEGEDLAPCISRASDSIGLKDVPSYEVIVGEQDDWIKKTQESFDCVEVSEGLWIVPEWKTPPDLQATNIILNPGLAFGTGEHPTTKMCLILLRSIIKGEEQFLDYGTGSGILAIAAVKFGASISVGVDIDPEAINSARRNSVLNNIGAERLQLNLIPSKSSFPSTERRPDEDIEKLASPCTGIMSEREKYDVVMANILLNPLLDLADDIVSYAKPGAVVSVTGILSEQLPCIMECYSQFLEGVSVLEMDGWACASGTKKINCSGT